MSYLYLTIKQEDIDKAEYFSPHAIPYFAAIRQFELPEAEMGIHNIIFGKDKRWDEIKYCKPLRNAINRKQVEPRRYRVILLEDK